MNGPLQTEPRSGTAEGGLPDLNGPGRLLASGYQGAVYLVETNAGPVIVKKAMGRHIVRAARRAMLRREYGIYRRLDGIAGVPRCLGLVDGGTLVLEFIAGPSLRTVRMAPAERAQFFTALLELIESVHAAGVAHGDLKRKDNILVGPGGRPFLIDFGTAVSAPPGARAWRRLLLRQVQRIDLNAWIKLKYRGRFEEIALEDLSRFRPTLPERVARIVRRAWRSMTLRRRRKARRRSAR